MWIRSEVDLGDHPKLLGLAIILNISPVEAVGYLHYLWWWVRRYAQDGDLARFSTVTIAHAAHWTGDSNVFVHALATCGDRNMGFLDETQPGEYTVHDWHSRQSWMYSDRDRQRRHREKLKQSGGSRDTNVTATETGRDKPVMTTRDSTAQHNDDDLDPRKENTSSSLPGGAGGVTSHRVTQERDKNVIVTLRERLESYGFTDAPEVIEKHGNRLVGRALDWIDAGQSKAANPGALLRTIIETGNIPISKNAKPEDPEKYFKGRLGHVVQR